MSITIAVNRFVADAFSPSFQRQDTTDLRGGESFSKSLEDIFFKGILEFIGLPLPALFSTLLSDLCLIGGISQSVSGQFPTDGGGTYAHLASNVFLAKLLLIQGLDGAARAVGIFG